MTSPFDFASCQLSWIAATAASTRQYSVPAVSAHAKDEVVAKTPAMSTDRTFQISLDWQSSNDLVPLNFG
ncbi:MAG TPA: hypothetical protein VK598_07115, partial [Nitrospiraceae bacterium]|nr:hypothetical protein [Nitrospiraceae bacterium]